MLEGKTNMENLTEISVQKLLDAYKQVNDFIKYLEMEENNLEE